jgi:hypothetical protein
VLTDQRSATNMCLCKAIMRVHERWQILTECGRLSDSKLQNGTRRAKDTMRVHRGTYLGTCCEAAHFLPLPLKGLSSQESFEWGATVLALVLCLHPCPRVCRPCCCWLKVLGEAHKSWRAPSLEAPP